MLHVTAMHKPGNVQILGARAQVVCEHFQFKVLVSLNNVHFSARAGPK